MRPPVSPYDALCAKVRAMYGKRLRFADFERLGRCTSEQEVLDALRQFPAWSVAMAELEPSADAYVGRVELENALSGETLREYQALMHYIPQGDRQLMQFPVLLAERDAILRALRRLKAGPDYHGMPHPSRFLNRSRIDAQAIELCRDYTGLLSACAGSIYAPVLTHLQPEDGTKLPDYMMTESLLRTAYFTNVYRIVHRRYSGETKALLLRAFGKQIDLLNLIHILRIKTYFPEMQDLFTVLFPFHYRLRPEFIRALCAAPDAASAFALVRRSPYAGSFRDMAVAEVEDYYHRAFYEFNRRQLLTGAPSVYTAISYLNLKDTECALLTNVVESVKYGVPYDSGFARLIGG
ncbi:MAG: V-type ATPase subunit [Oscillibacter sp.]|jgi:V/A-type H+-transporting ATPase subunit C|nr:V-type ATPase subunit [Oscillibacter sp.]